MTRKEEIEKQAFAVYPIIMETLIPLCTDHEEVKQDCNQFLRKAYINGIKWADSTAWKPADGDNLPEIDREVIAIIKENDHFKVVFAHRPPEYWDGRNILTNEVTRNYTKRYDKGEWNQPNVKWWLDLELPKMEMEKV